MKYSGRRYHANELEEGLFEPGSHHRVLKNLLEIKQKRRMDQIEFQALSETMEILIDSYDQQHRFTAKDICYIHKLWLQNVYSWAGQYRKVNLQKDGFPFAAASQIAKLMLHFEKNELKKYSPCCFATLDENIRAIAVIHTELVLIHPFREGNGRIARILSSLMALQAGLPLLDFGTIRGKKRQEYFAAVRAGLNKNYQPMEQIFRSIIKRSLKTTTINYFYAC